MNKYRIEEYCGKFSIQIYSFEQTGILWWKRKIWDWYSTNAWGGVWQSYPICEPHSKTYNSLEEAQQRIEKWNNKPVYHYCKE